jgi:hypothetical protein
MWHFKAPMALLFPLVHQRVAVKSFSMLDLAILGGAFLLQLAMDLSSLAAFTLALEVVLRPATLQFVHPVLLHLEMSHLYQGRRAYNLVHCSLHQEPHCSSLVQYMLDLVTALSALAQYHLNLELWLE